MNYLPGKVEIYDVCCRDGFQNEKNFIETEKKIEVANSLSNLGFKRIEVTSFVSPKAVPQMRDAAEVMQKINKNPSTSYMGLAPNLKGAQRAIEAGIDELNIVISVSEAHNKANINMTVDESLINLKDIMAIALPAKVDLNISLATSFGCPFTGDVKPEEVTKLAMRIMELGPVKFIFGDTTGMANPLKVYRLMENVKDRLPDGDPTLHFHNTRGFALANILAGLEMGVVKFDGALGGLGGCPFAPGASGNVATEDIIHMFSEMNIETGINLDGLIEAARNLEKVVARPLSSYILRSGKIKDLHSCSPGS